MGAIVYTGYIVSFWVIVGFLFYFCWAICRQKYDKAMHSILSLALTWILLGVFSYTPIPWWFSAVITAQLGIVKEAYDKYIKNLIIDPWDLLADCVGIATVFFVYLLSF
jgi:hypothetical protein